MGLGGQVALGLFSTEGDVNTNTAILLAWAMGALATQLPAIVERLLAGPG